MATQTLDIEPPVTSDSGPESGVIRDARRHRRRERTAASLLVSACIAAALVLIMGGNAGQPARASSSRPTWLAGAPLHKPTHLRLIVSGNTPRVSIVDVDSGRVSTVRGLGLPHRYSLQGPMIWSLTPAPGGALAVIWRQSCGHCLTLTSFRIAADGLARRTATVTAKRHQQATQATGSTTGIWVLTRPRSGRCTLKLVPGSRAAVAAPCGTLGADTAAGLVLERSGKVTLVDPWTGRVRERVAIGSGGQFDFLGHDIALIGSSPGDGASSDTLTLDEPIDRCPHPPAVAQQPPVRLLRDPRPPRAAGRDQLRRPRGPGAPPSQRPVAPGPAYRQVHAPTRIPDLRGPQVLQRRWTADGRLVIAAQGHGRTALAMYRPGSAQLQVGRVPRLSGYSEMVPLSR